MHLSCSFPRCPRPMQLRTCPRAHTTRGPASATTTGISCADRASIPLTKSGLTLSRELSLRLRSGTDLASDPLMHHITICVDVLRELPRGDMVDMSFIDQNGIEKSLSTLRQANASIRCLKGQSSPNTSTSTIPPMTSIVGCLCMLTGSSMSSLNWLRGFTFVGTATALCDLHKPTRYLLTLAFRFPPLPPHSPTMSNDASPLPVPIQGWLAAQRSKLQWLPIRHWDVQRGSCW